MNVNDRPINVRRDGAPWMPSSGTGLSDLPPHLLSRPVENWRDKTWQLSPKDFGTYPDAVSKYNDKASTWTGRIVDMQGRVYEYSLIWRGDNVVATFERRGRRVGHVTIPLDYYFPFDEKLVAGVTTIDHIADHIDPASEQDVRRQESAYWAAATDDDPDWTMPDGEYRVGAQRVWHALKQIAGGADDTLTDKDTDEDVARAAVVPHDGLGIGYDEMANLWQVSRRQAERIAATLVESGLLRSGDDPGSRGGKPRRLFWGVEG